MGNAMEADIERVYEALEGGDAVEEYHDAHGVRSMTVLTITNESEAVRRVRAFRDRIAGKIVVEIGSGVGLAALEMARYAERVYAIEADPAWSWVFVRHLYRAKPANLTWVFGGAESVAGLIKADVAVVFTHSDRDGMRAMAERFAPEVIMGYSDDVSRRVLAITASRDARHD
jgi:predicted O-methyltransferase YrrM